jgi:copper chaperone CopZ
MTHTYKVTGMTCDGCSAKVSHLLKQVQGVSEVQVNLEAGEANITMDKHVETPVLQNALKYYPKYSLTEKENGHKTIDVFNNQLEEPKSWLATYKPILLIFAYITTTSSIIAFDESGFHPMLFMRVFMAGFFLTFSFFKMLDLNGFASSYSMYDVVARRIPVWGYVYAFIELGLGFAFILDFAPFFINAFTAAIMTISLVGVLQSVLNKRKIQCACLGAVFNLPMSTVTIIEDGLMIAMSVAMLLML